MKLHETRAKEIDNLLNGKLPITNFNPAILCTYLQHMTFGLKSSDKEFLTDKEEKDLIELTKDTLFITDNFLRMCSSFTDCILDDREKAMKNYLFPYKMISMDELNSKLSSNPDIYYMIYFFQETSFMLMKNGEFIYASKNVGSSPPSLNAKLMIKHLVGDINKK